MNQPLQIAVSIEETKDNEFRSIIATQGVLDSLLPNDVFAQKRVLTYLINKLGDE